jgi:hypothetical protein
VFLQSASCWWPREVGYKMIGMLVETGVVSDAYTSDFLFDCGYLEVSADDSVGDIPWSIRYVRAAA